MIEKNTTQKAEGLGTAVQETPNTNIQTSPKTFLDWRTPEGTAELIAWLKAQPLKEWPNWQKLGKRAIAAGLFAPSKGATNAGNILAKVWRRHTNPPPPKIVLTAPKQAEQKPALRMRMGIGNCTLTDPLPAVPPFETEQQFLLGLKAYLRAGRYSSIPGLAEVAREWERIFNFRILMTEQYRQRRAARREKRLALKIQVSVSNAAEAPRPSCEGATACPSSSRSSTGVSPSPE